MAAHDNAAPVEWAAMRLRRLLPALLVLTAPLFAGDDELPPDEVADIVDRYVERGYESLRDGSYDEARLRFEKALKRDPANEEAWLGTIVCDRDTGAYDDADEALAKLFEVRPDSRRGRTRKAELDLVRGRFADVRTAMETLLAEPADEPDLAGLRGRVLLAAALEARGRRGDARTVLDPLIPYYKKRYDVWNAAVFNIEKVRMNPEEAWPLSEELTLVARALRMYVELSPLDYPFIENAFDVLGWAADLDPGNWEARIEYVRVSRVEREQAIARARKIKALADQRNPELADLYAEVAESVLVGWNGGEARDLCDTALLVNPSQTKARAILARLNLEDNRYSEAEEHIAAGLKVNPKHRDLLALRATLELLLGDEEAFEKGMAELLAIDPTYGEGFHLAALVVASRQRRYDRAVSLIRRGLRIDGTNFEAQATLGVFLANLGRADEAAEVLKRSQKALPFSHPIRDNFAEVLDYVLRSMAEQRSEHFVIRYDPSEYEIMSRFMPQLLEECWADMVKRYGFTPEAPVLVEVFKNADDFSVRTLGLPGIPALGACFGGLITLDSPQALPAGTFLWASTARHEFAHVMSLQLSKGQVPRWFTEGLSVLEERPLDTGWGLDADFERQVFDAHVTGTIPSIATFDAMFRGPRVAYAYYVGGLMLQVLEERSGEEGIVEALRLYGKNRSMSEVFEKAFGLELKEFDRVFAQFIAERVSHYKLTPNYAPLLAQLMRERRANPDDGEVWAKIAWAYLQRGKVVDAGAALDKARRILGTEHPQVLLLDGNMQLRARRAEKARKSLEAFVEQGGEDYQAFMTLASFAARDGEEEKLVELLKKAKKAWPVAAEGANPYSLLRRHYMAKGMQAEALAELEQQVRIRSTDIGLRLQLAREYRFLERDRDALRVLEEALRVTLFDRRVHEEMLPLLRKLDQKKKAIRAARCVVALRAEEDSDFMLADRWLDLAEVLFEDGQSEEARAALSEARKLVDADVMPRIGELEKKIHPAGQ
jgi:tetratricopeptide (TPR) repeat protein